MASPETRKRVLVVDDEADVQELVCRVLEDTGYAVDSAGDGREALLKIGAAQPDLVVLDLMMPELDGWAVLQRLRRLAHPPRVVILSAFADCTRALEEGAAECLSKPFRFPQLLEACERALAA